MFRGIELVKQRKFILLFKRKYLRFLLSLSYIFKFIDIYESSQKSYIKNNYKFFLVNYTSFFYLTLPFRQHYFSIINFFDTDIHISVGAILNWRGPVSKCLKKSNVNINVVLLFFRKFYSQYLSRIYLFTIKNFNCKQYNFFMKFFEQLTPSILYFIHKHSFIPRFCPKRRIKRKI